MTKNKLSDKQIFNVARRLDSEEAVAEYLDQVCGDDAERRERIRGLLDADHKDSFLENRPVPLPETVESREPLETVGHSIGNYKLLQRIGEGGFGVVYMAEQTEPVCRQVALKVIKPGMDTKEVIARFEAERQALAMMDHPNIAKVFDGGETDSGRPFFVMGLVKGVPLTKFCDERKLCLDERLRLFEIVCGAIQHAHQKGVIHRDIKPSNVMVTLHDGEPVPQVIDFGVSKAINQRLTEKTLFTGYGQMVGTPQYMSPEQAEMSGLDIDTRSDIYSLGALLYELLTGTTPIQPSQLRQTAYVEIQRMIREDEPPRPSQRVSTLGKSLPSIAESRQVEPARLGGLFRRELDWIVMKALEKDRTRRYDTAVAFADDIQRYINNEVVQARPPSFGYRVRKYAVRNRRYVPLVVVLAASLLILGVFGAPEYLHNIQENRLVVESAIDSHYALASEYKSNKKYSQATHHYKEAASLMRQSSFSGDPRLKWVEHGLAEVYTLSENYDAAITLYEVILTALGHENGGAEAKQVAQALFLAYLSRAGQLAKSQATEDDLTKAIKLGDSAVRLARKHDLEIDLAWFPLVEAHYRRGDFRQALACAKTWLASGSCENMYPFCLWFAVLHSQLGEAEIAKDWLVVASEMWPPGKVQRDRHLHQDLREVATALIFGTSGETLESVPVEIEEQAYSEIVTRYRRCPALRRCRGYRRFQLGMWDSAASDFELAAEHTNYADAYYDVSRALMDRFQGRRENYLAARQYLFERLANGELGEWDQPRLILLLYMIEAEGIDIDTLSDLTDGMNVMAGSAAYRAGKYSVAVSLLKSTETGPVGSFADLFRAMAYKKLNKVTEAKSVLNQARETLVNSCPLPGRPRTTTHISSFTSVLWCHPLAVLPEAEDLIEGEYSLLGRAVVTGDYGPVVSSVDQDLVTNDKPEVALSNAKE